jgi:hypothetical protein
MNRESPFVMRPVSPRVYGRVATVDILNTQKSRALVAGITNEQELNRQMRSLRFETRQLVTVRVTLIKFIIARRIGRATRYGLLQHLVPMGRTPRDERRPDPPREVRLDYDVRKATYGLNREDVASILAGEYRVLMAETNGIFRKR